MKITRDPLIIGNWKMNPLLVDSAKRLALDVAKKAKKIENATLVVAPPALFIGEVAKVVRGSVLLGAQDASSERIGAHTGDIALSMLREMGVTYVIIGHSERRKKGESETLIAQKVRATLKERMTPVLCIGEWERDHEGGYYAIIETQIRSALQGVSQARLRDIVIAYEPVWAIGGKVSAGPEIVQEMKLFIQKILTDLYGRNVASTTRILYGGSVNEKNAELLYNQSGVDGFLVGSASLNAESFIQIALSVV